MKETSNKQTRKKIVCQMAESAMKKNKQGQRDREYWGGWPRKSFLITFEQRAHLKKVRERPMWRAGEDALLEKTASVNVLRQECI